MKFIQSHYHSGWMWWRWMDRYRPWACPFKTWANSIKNYSFFHMKIEKSIKTIFSKKHYGLTFCQFPLRGHTGLSIYSRLAKNLGPYLSIRVVYLITVIDTLHWVFSNILKVVFLSMFFKTTFLTMGKLF